jgi:hypothetical protein
MPVRGCRGVAGTRPTRRRATPTDAGMRAQAEGSPRAVAAVAPRSRVGVFTTWLETWCAYRRFKRYNILVTEAIANSNACRPNSHARGARSPCRSQRPRFRYRFCVPPKMTNPRLRAGATWWVVVILPRLPRRPACAGRVALPASVSLHHGFSAACGSSRHHLDLRSASAVLTACRVI